MAIQKVSTDTKEAIARKSVQFLPNNPSARGMTADQIRKAFYVPVTDTAASVLSEIDRVADEANTALDNEATARIEAINEVSENVKKVAEDLLNESTKRKEEIEELGEKDSELDEKYSGLDEKYAPLHSPAQGITRVWTSDGTNGYWMKTCYGKETQALSGNIPVYVGAANGKNAISGYLITNVPTNDYHAANKKYVDEKMDVVDPRLTAFETALSGKSRSYVLESLTSVDELLAGRWEIGEETYYAEDLMTGDNILVIEKEVPDFWFEKTDDASREADTYIYSDENGEEKTMELRVYAYGESGGGPMCGLLHILESDYTVIEGYSKAASTAAEEAAESAREALEAMDGKVDKVPAQAGKQYTVAAVDKDGNPTSLAVDVGGYGFAIPLRETGGRLRVPAPTIDSHAINRGYLNGMCGTHEDRISTLEKITGLAEPQYVTVEGTGETVTVPDGALPAAQILKLEGSDGSYEFLGYYYYFYKNYPKRIVTDTGDVVLELPDDVETRLADFGIGGNYIYFEDGKAFYKQTVRFMEYFDLPEEGEELLYEYYDTAKIVKLASPIVTDVSDYIATDGTININNAKSLTVEPKVSEQEIKALDEADGDTVDYSWSVGVITFVFEV